MTIPLFDNLLIENYLDQFEKANIQYSNFVNQTTTSITNLLLNNIPHYNSYNNATFSKFIQNFGKYLYSIASPINPQQVTKEIRYGNYTRKILCKKYFGFIFDNKRKYINPNFIFYYLNDDFVNLVIDPKKKKNIQEFLNFKNNILRLLKDFGPVKINTEIEHYTLSLLDFNKHNQTLKRTYCFPTKQIPNKIITHVIPILTNINTPLAYNNNFYESSIIDKLNVKSSRNRFSNYGVDVESCLSGNPFFGLCLLFISVNKNNSSFEIMYHVSLDGRENNCVKHPLTLSTTPLAPLFDSHIDLRYVSNLEPTIKGILNISSISNFSLNDKLFPINLVDILKDPAIIDVMHRFDKLIVNIDKTWDFLRCKYAGHYMANNNDW